MILIVMMILSIIMNVDLQLGNYNHHCSKKRLYSFKWVGWLWIVLFNIILYCTFNSSINENVTNIRQSS